MVLEVAVGANVDNAWPDGPFPDEDAELVGEAGEEVEGSVGGGLGHVKCYSVAEEKMNELVPSGSRINDKKPMELDENENRHKKR